jgi:dTDP-4-dehydrorhamnose reductase
VAPTARSKPLRLPESLRPVLLIGANGQLGSDLSHEIQHLTRPLLALTRAHLDLRNHQEVADRLEAANPEVIVNTAAFHKVEACEADPDQAFAVNSLGVRNLANVADRIGARLVHISTDYVFDGETNTPYSEADQPNPINVYGTSKVAGEYFVRSLCKRHLVVRTSGLYGLAGSSGKGGNFVQTMLRLGRERGTVSVVTDQTLSPTYTRDLARMIRLLIESDAEGLFHVTNAGHCSWNEFARAIFELASQPVRTEPVTTVSMGASVKRPRFSALANDRLLQSGIGEMRPWRDALADYLQVAGQAAAAPSFIH